MIDQVRAKAKGKARGVEAVSKEKADQCPCYELPPGVVVGLVERSAKLHVDTGYAYAFGKRHPRLPVRASCNKCGRVLVSIQKDER